ncbi:MAG: polysaccharide deacetylase family protein [Pirellulaceae bacterium]
MMRYGMLLVMAWAGMALSVGAADVGNRLTYLDGPVDPYVVGLQTPKLSTPQWVGEEGVEAVIVLAVDDMSDVQKYETFLRPILDRLKQIDGRAALSIMTQKVDPQAPQLTQWLAEGVSIEPHTTDHPCPLLQKADRTAAKSTYDRCVEGLAAIPGNSPTAFRMPCCDSMNSVSPRFFAEIFNKVTPQGRFATIDTSVFQVFSAEDPELPRESVTDEDGRGKFTKYIPVDRKMVNYVENYPYPYVIGRLCWEFPSLMPSDWDAQQVNGKCSPVSVRDLQAAIDATVAKQGVFALCFHPHGWMNNTQIVELIDYAQARYAGKIKFLSFRDVAERLTKNLLGGHPLRNAAGGDNGVRVLDVDNNGYMDVVIGNPQAQITRLWTPATRQWRETSFPVRLVAEAADVGTADAGVRFGVLHPDGSATVMVNAEQRGVWHHNGEQWLPEEAGKGIPLPPCPTSSAGCDQGVRLIDLDLNGVDELVVANPSQQAVYRLAGSAWEATAWSLPRGLVVVDSAGRDGSLRFVDLDDDGHLDLVFSNAERSAAYVFTSLGEGWSRQLLDGPRNAETSLPMIVREDGTNNGVWFKNHSLWVQNEDTGCVLPNCVEAHFQRDMRPLLPGTPAGEAAGTPPPGKQ